MGFPRWIQSCDFPRYVYVSVGLSLWTVFPEIDSCSCDPERLCMRLVIAVVCFPLQSRIFASVPDNHTIAVSFLVWAAMCSAEPVVSARSSTNASGPIRWALVVNQYCLFPTASQWIRGSIVSMNNTGLRASPWTVPLPGL